jgi:hypothetical protein
MMTIAEFMQRNDPWLKGFNIQWSLEEVDASQVSANRAGKVNQLRLRNGDHWVITIPEALPEKIWHGALTSAVESLVSAAARKVAS